MRRPPPSRHPSLKRAPQTTFAFPLAACPERRDREQVVVLLSRLLLQAARELRESEAVDERS
jgi:hypothetical protein